MDPNPFPNRETELNWTPGERLKYVNHTQHSLAVPAGDIGKVHRALSEFRYFDGGHNDVAVVYEKWHGNVRYAIFDAKGVFAWLASWVNPRVIFVRIACSNDENRVIGDTAGRHMLVGQRRWQVCETEHGLLVQSEAYDRPNGAANRAGMAMMGKGMQLKVWTLYFLNLRQRLNSTSKVVVLEPERVLGNPWRPVDPYQPCG